MSDINYSVSYRISKGYLGSTASADGVTATMSQTGMLSQALTLSTNAASIQTASLASVGMAFLRNLSTDTAHTVTLGIEAGGSFVGLTTLRAGEAAMFRMSTGTDYKAIGVSGSRLRVDITEG